MSQELRIVKVTIKDARRIKYAELNFGKQQPGKGQLIELFAGNDQGKTTLHDMLKSIFEPGKHPDLIREGCTKAICVMELSDGVQIIRTHEPDESTYDVIGANGVDIPAPATYIKKLAKSFAFDPIAFDEADSKKQLEYILSVSDIEFTPEEIREGLGEAAALGTVPDENLNIATFGKFQKSITDLRAATGRQQKEKAGAIEALRKTLVTADTEVVDPNWDATKELQSLQAQKDKIEKDLRDDIAGIRADANPHRLAIDLDIQRRVDEAKAVLQKTLQDLMSEKLLKIAVIDKAEKTAIDEVTSQASTSREAIAQKIGEAQTMAQAQAAATSTRTLMKKYEGETVQLAAQYDALDAAAKTLEAMRKSKIESGFVRGLEVREDGRIYVDGIPWKNGMNQAARYLKAMEIAAQGTGDLGWITADRGEGLDIDSHRTFQRAVEKSGLQVLLFSVASAEQIKEYGPELQTIPPGLIPKLELAPKRRQPRQGTL